MQLEGLRAKIFHDKRLKPFIVRNRNIEKTVSHEMRYVERLRSSTETFRVVTRSLLEEAAVAAHNHLHLCAKNVRIYTCTQEITHTHTVYIHEGIYMKV